METRSSPSITVLRSLAVEAGMEVNTSKTQLFQMLQSRFDLDRLERVRNRGMKRQNMLIEDIRGAEDNSVDRIRSKTEVTPHTKCKQYRPKRKNKACRALTMEQSPLIDPVMLSEIPEGVPRFTFTRPNGTKVDFIASSLADYLLSTGDFFDPESRLPFQDTDLAKLDKVIAKNKLGKESVLKAKLNPNRFEDMKFKRDALCGLERMAGEVVADMAKAIESEDGDHGQMVLVMSLFPAFTDLYQQMLQADATSANMCMDHFMTYVEGPPNRPTDDNCGLLHVVLSFLSEVKAGSTASAHPGSS